MLSVILTAYWRLRREIRQRLQAERKLADQLSFQEALMESLPYPLVAKDSDNRYLAINHAYESAFGVERDEIIGHTTPETRQYQGVWNERFHELGTQVLQSSSAYHAELRLPDALGHERVWLYWMRPFHLTYGRMGGLLASLVDVTDIREAEQRASALDQRLKRITANLPAVVFELRRAPNGHLSFPYVGGNTRAMWDLSAEDMVANERLAFARVHPDDQHIIEEAVDESVRSMQPLSIVIRSMAHNRERWINAEATPKREDDGSVFWSGVWVDVTEARAQSKALADAKEEAEAAAAAKASFLATMSHEIRTPMNGVLGLLELLGEGPLTANQQRMLRMVDDSAVALMQILNDVLDFSKIEAGQLTLAPTPLDLRVLIDNVLGVASTLAHEKGLYVRNTIDPLLAAEVIGDGVRLRQILFNLLSNATKFTEEGEIGVSLEVLASDADQQCLRLTVHDSGIGMTAEQQHKLFEPFVQADASIASRFGGTGLGLTICQHLVSMMAGSLTMRSVPDHGTTVIVELSLPVHRLKAESPLRGYSALLAIATDDALALAGMLKPLGVTVNEHTDKASLRFVDELDNIHDAGERAIPHIVVTDEPSPLGYTVERNGTCMLSRNPLSWAAVQACCRQALGLPMPATEHVPELTVQREEHPGLVLVAEDNPTNRLLIQEQLERLSYRCLIVGDGVEALGALSTHNDITLLITDCNMPLMDGYTLASTIRSTETADKHLPIIALTASALSDEAARCAKAGMDALLVKPTGMAALRDALYRWMPTSMPAQARLPPEVVSANTTLNRLFGSDARRAVLVESFVTSTHEDLAKLDAAIDGDDADEVAGRIHRMGGAMRIFGANDLADEGERLRSVILDVGLASQHTALARYRHDLVKLIDSLQASTTGDGAT